MQKGSRHRLAGGIAGAVCIALALAGCSSSKKAASPAASSAAPSAAAPSTTSSAPSASPASPASSAPAAPASTPATSAPASPAAPAAGTVSLTSLDYYSSDPYKSFVSAHLQSCAAAAGATITSQDHVPGGQLTPKILQDISAHTLPSLLMIDNPGVQAIAATGALVPLTDVGVDPTTGIFPGILAAGTYKGKVYGMAPSVNSIALFYNKDLLTAAGLSVPKTWADLTADAKALTTPAHYGLAFSADNDGEGAWHFLPFLWSNGGDFEHLASPAAVQALTFESDFVKSGSASKSVVSWSQGDVNDQFAAGKAAMEINGPWNIAPLDKLQNIHYGIAPIPVPAAGKTLVAPLGGEMWTVPQTTPAQEAAAGKVVTCMNSPANQLAYNTDVVQVPTLKAVAAQYGQSYPPIQSFITEVSTAMSRTAEVGPLYPTVQTALETAIQAAITGAASPASALKTAAATVAAAPAP
jgi:multiple sugar transport system substrate-binding protein